MKRIVALFLCIFMIMPMMFSCSEDPVDPVTKQAIDIPQKIFIADGGEIYTRLYSMYVSDSDNEAIKTEAKNLLSLMKGWEYIGTPIGGSQYSGTIYETGDYIVNDDNDMKAAVRSAKAGEVIFIPSGVTIDMSDLFTTETFTAKLKEGVILASDRGKNEGGTLKFSHPTGDLLICYSNTTITGLNLCGVIAPSGVMDTDREDYGIRIDGENVTISNCEFASFSGSAISRKRLGNAKVDNCFFHHCENGIIVTDNAVTVTNSAFFECKTNISDGKNELSLPDGNGILTATEPADMTIERVNPDIVSAVYPADSYEVYSLVSEISEGNTDKVIEALSVHSGTTNYYQYKDKISIEKDGKVYGVTDDGSPLGGGKGYSNIYTSGDFTVTTAQELADALDEATSGDVIFIPSNVKIDITAWVMTVPKGVILASDRGTVREDGSVSTGGMLYTTTRYKEAVKLSEDAVFTGITLVGADTERHMTHHKRGLNSTGSAYTNYYYSLLLTRGISVIGNGAEVSNCEISGFSEAGVFLDKCVDVKVHHNYIHHNQRNGFGYGIVLYGTTYVEAYRNLFNFDRHAIAADGSAKQGYQAHDNVHMGTAIYHIFDAHGGGDRGDGTQIACERIDMYNNAFLSDKIPYKKRGTPTEYSKFTQNVIIYPESFYPYRYLYGTNFICEDNIFGIADPVVPDYSFENGEAFDLKLNRQIRKYEDLEYIDSKNYSLRYAYFLVFTPTDDGYYINEYGNNLDNGSIYGWNEKVYIPEGGFVLAFTKSHTEAKRLYDAIEKRHGVIYNTSITLDGDYIAKLDGDVLTVTQSN